ncbi:MAG: hypothetical protein AAGA30_04665, partial [Planctomycetota bacterium]
AQATLISSIQLADFLAGKTLSTETDIRARRGAFLLNYQFELQADCKYTWEIVAEINQDQTDIANLEARIQSDHIVQELEDEISNGENKLADLIARADGFQAGGNLARAQRHQSNAMFNIMRGGIPVNDYRVDTYDLISHIRSANRVVAEKNSDWLGALPDSLTREELVNRAKKQGDVHLLRIITEYIPLVFSRRHGDPTRPWNKFSINSHMGTKQRLFDYQGNWRDIFQNWEALAYSYPQFLESMVCRFVNASTADGYNPYRLTKSGFEWECPEPENPWANIGYWCDHQIIYLLKLLELSRSCFPGRLDSLLNENRFVFANVPYRIKSAEQIFENPRDTVEFDLPLNKEIERRVELMGNDGKLLLDQQGDIQNANLFEKLLLPALVKLSNFVPDGGVWLNTQRPEWNDAHNALVGYGLSVVTTCYLRRYFAFLRDWFGECELGEFSVAEDLAVLMDRMQLAVSPYLQEEQIRISPAQRYEIIRDLSQAGSHYRRRVYENGLAGPKRTVSKTRCIEFFEQSLRILDATIHSNRRADGLYHSYNLMSNDVANETSVERLYEMLEGQVAVLSSGLLDIEEVLELLRGLRASQIYRADQDSYMLYPNRELPRFMEKNHIPSGLVNQSALLKALLSDGDESIVRKDVHGNCHFNGTFRNGEDVKRAVEKLRHDARYEESFEGAAEHLSSIFENMFCHHQFTGRSGTFFAYEGLGSIYWHMVSKLQLAVAEIYLEAEDSGVSEEKLQELKNHYCDIRRGIGAEKSPADYGAFPTDPYSHTPEHAGAQQPGMTGQVKEDVISRFLELGLRIDKGCLRFSPTLFDVSEMLDSPQSIALLNPDSGQLESAEVAKGEFAYSLCGIPITYVQAEYSYLKVTDSHGNEETLDEMTLSFELTQQMFARDSSIRKIEIGIVSTVE